MIEDLLNKLIAEEYDGYKVFVHNLSNFDALFILDILNQNFNVKLIRNNGRIISIKISKTIKDADNKNKVISLTFYDSYQILPSSLKKLAISFNTNSQKDIFPFDFVNKNNLDYNGSVPPMDQFPKGTFNSKEEYDNYVSKFNNNWDLREISTAYCKLDCISLYQVLIKYSDMV